MAVLRKLGIDRARLDDGAAFACIPLLPPLGSPAPQVVAVLQEVAEFALGSDDGSGVVVAIDDLSLLAGVRGDRVAVELVQACRSWARRNPKHPTSIVVRAMDLAGAGAGEWEEEGDEEDEWGLPLVPLLLRQADALVEVRPLNSGYSRDVHGLVSWHATGHAQACRYRSVERVPPKLNERSLFACPQ